VETKGRTLEEINEIFEAKDPVKKSLQKHIVEDTDLGLLYHGLMNELQDMEGVISPIFADPDIVLPGFAGSPGSPGAIPDPHIVLSPSFMGPPGPTYASSPANTYPPSRSQ